MQNSRQRSTSDSTQDAFFAMQHISLVNGHKRYALIVIPLTIKQIQILNAKCRENALPSASTQDALFLSRATHIAR